jgi:four helix bundle protein
MSFPFEKLTVYQASLDLIRSTESIIQSSKGSISYFYLEQLGRAILSISLNIAEGNGRWNEREKARFIRIARGSAFECVPILQMMWERKVIDDLTYRSIYGRLESVSKMLTNLARSLHPRSVGKVNPEPKI